jgi:hypothetical protein
MASGRGVWADALTNEPDNKSSAMKILLSHRMVAFSRADFQERPALASPTRSTSSFRDAPSELGFTRVRHYTVQVGNSRLGWCRPGIQPHARFWIPGSREEARPGMTG